MMTRPPHLTIGLLAAVALLSGCAASSAPFGDPVQTASVLPVAAGGTPPASAGAYQMSPQELALECKQLAGRMQIRILEIRDYNERNSTTLASRALQSGVSAVFGGSKSGTDPNGAYARDRAMLEAYNRQLAAKGCKSYDLDAELQPKSVLVTPAATVKPVVPAAKK